MNAWTFFFILLGVSYLTAQFFRLIDAIQHAGKTGEVVTV